MVLYHWLFTDFEINAKNTQPPIISLEWWKRYDEMVHAVTLKVICPESYRTLLSSVWNKYGINMPLLTLACSSKTCFNRYNVQFCIRRSLFYKHLKDLCHRNSMGAQCIMGYLASPRGIVSSKIVYAHMVSHAFCVER